MFSILKSKFWGRDAIFLLLAPPLSWQCHAQKGATLPPPLLTVILRELEGTVEGQISEKVEEIISVPCVFCKWDFNAAVNDYVCIA